MKLEIKLTRKVVLAIVRAYCRTSGMYARASVNGIGLDECEESVKELIEYGLLVIYVDEENDLISIEPPEESDEPFA